MFVIFKTSNKDFVSTQTTTQHDRNERNIRDCCILEGEFVRLNWWAAF